MTAGADEVYGFIHTEEFLNAWRRVNVEPMQLSQFSELPMPAGCRPEDLWEICSALRRNAGSTLPFPPYLPTAGNAAWFSTPKVSQDELAELAAESKKGSLVATMLEDSAAGDYTLRPLLSEEVFSLSRRDGLRIPQESIRGLWMRTRAPRDASERMVANLVTVFNETSRYLSKPITRGLIEEVHDAIMDSAEETETTARSRFDLPDKGPYEDPDFTLGMVKLLAEGGGSGNGINPIYASINMTSLFWDLTPFSQGNAMTEFVVRRIHLIKSGYPALAYTSFSHCMQRWEEGRPSFNPGFSFDELTVDSNEGLDATIFHSVAVRGYLYELGKLKDALQNIHDDDAYYVKVLDEKTGLNARQKGIIAQVLRNPDLRITISNYSSAYSVVYATARADLMELVDLGFLAYHKSGRAFIFQGVLHLSDMLDSMR